MWCIMLKSSLGCCFLIFYFRLLHRCSWVKLVFSFIFGTIFFRFQYLWRQWNTTFLRCRKVFHHLYRLYWLKVDTIWGENCDWKDNRSLKYVYHNCNVGSLFRRFYGKSKLDRSTMIWNNHPCGLKIESLR